MRWIQTFLFLSIALPALAAPNIVFVIIDDLDMAVWNNALERGYLPNIKTHIIDHGTTFTESFVSQSLCCPSRATMHTGQYPQNHGVTGNNGVYDPFKLYKESTALATWFVGYRTGFMGKYLNGAGQEVEIHKPAGWEEWRGMVKNRDNPDSTAQCMYGFTLADGNGRSMYGNHIVDNSTNPPTVTLDPAGYQTDVLADLSVAFILNPDTRPFFLVVSPTAPHIEDCFGIYRDPTILDADGRNDVNIRTAQRYTVTEVDLPAEQAPSYNEADVTDKPRNFLDMPPGNVAITKKRKRLFNEKVSALRPIDDMVGRIVTALGPKITDTLFIVASDNGYQYGTHRLSGKQDFYEESIRVPLVIRAPGQTDPTVKDEWVLNNDWAPTIADYAGITPKVVMDGRSLRPLIEGASYVPRQTFMIRTGANVSDAPTEPDHVPFAALRTKNPRLTGDGRILIYAETYFNQEYTDMDVELYDMQTDPYQIDSDPAHPHMMSLKVHLSLMKTCSGDSCRELED